MKIETSARSIFVIALLVVAAASNTTEARPVPGFQGTTVNDADERATDLISPADPEVLEPIRPLFPFDQNDGAMIVRPEPCGALTPFMFGLTFVSLSVVGAGRRNGLHRGS